MADTPKNHTQKRTTANTNAAYNADWRHFLHWCRLRGSKHLPPSPDLIGTYITDLAAPQGSEPTTTTPRGLAVTTIERRLSGLVWQYQQRGFILDRKHDHITTTLADIRDTYASPPTPKKPILPEDILAMIGTLAFDLRGLRDRAILLVGYAGGLRRQEIVGIDIGKDDTPNSAGWVEILEGGALLTLNAKTSWREVEIGRGSSEQSCPVHALEQWLHFAKITSGPVFVRTSRNGKRALATRLSDKHVARLIKQTVAAAGLRSDLPENERLALFSVNSLRAGLAHVADVDDRALQEHLGHSSTSMPRRRQSHRDRFRVNVTKAAGL